MDEGERSIESVPLAGLQEFRRTYFIVIFATGDGIEVKFGDLEWTFHRILLWELFPCIVDFGHIVEDGEEFVDGDETLHLFFESDEGFAKGAGNLLPGDEVLIHEELDGEIKVSTFNLIEDTEVLLELNG